MRIVVQQVATKECVMEWIRFMHLYLPVVRTENGEPFHLTLGLNCPPKKSGQRWRLGGGGWQRLQLPGSFLRRCTPLEHNRTEWGIWWPVWRDGDYIVIVGSIFRSLKWKPYHVLIETSNGLYYQLNFIKSLRLCNKLQYISNISRT